eukprot:m.209829 g.209829  ORF g.209829 m.209829 type:complete len:151 (-) comp15819_c0_seq20:1594-2046(-)
MVTDTLQSELEDFEADIFMLHNADLYMPYWRRTLAEILLSRKPIVLTTYCEFEGHKMNRMFKWHETEFSSKTLQRCDQYVENVFGSDLAQTHIREEIRNVPRAKIIWDFQQNPFAHAPPRNCYGGTEHGVRNSYWMSFKGEGLAQDKDEL